MDSFQIINLSVSVIQFFTPVFILVPACSTEKVWRAWGDLKFSLPSAGNAAARSEQRWPAKAGEDPVLLKHHLCW